MMHEAFSSQRSKCMARIMTIQPLLMLVIIASHPSYCQRDNSAVSSFVNCKNGGRYDQNHFTCRCTPFYHGRYCQSSFSSQNPCSNISSIPVIADNNAVHRLGNTQDCRIDNTCMDFYQIPESWYRMKSDAGSYLIDSCPTNENACGSRQAVVLTNVMREDNNNVPLFSADAVAFDRSKVGQSPCHDEYDVRYPVRILQCSAGQKLYYLRNLPGMRMHYCIGDKEKCEKGTRSVANNGFAPCVETDECVPAAIVNARRPELTQIYMQRWMRTSSLISKFRCTAFASHRHTSGVTYKMQWSLTLSNGSSMIIGGSGCRKEGIHISEDGNATMECPFEDLFLRNLFAYGGTLTCQLLAKCNKTLAEYRTAPVVSNSHSLSFEFYYKSNNSVLTPGEKVELCVDVTRFPPIGTATFYFSVARQRIISRDRLQVNIVNRKSNDTNATQTSQCGVRLSHQKVICRQMILRNNDEDGQYPLGLTRAQQISVVKVNVSFNSPSNGMNTRGVAKQIKRVEIKIDMSKLQKEPTSYLHIYNYLRVKPSHKDYMSHFVLHEPYGLIGYRIAMRHKMLPYEFQIRFQKDINGLTYTTGVAIRYEYYVIRIYGNRGQKLQVDIKSELPKFLYRHTIPRKSDSMPQGVKLERNGLMLKLHLELYGVVMFVFGFGAAASQCQTNFVINSQRLRNTHCGSSPVFVGYSRALEVMITPGFYDTQQMVTGLMYGNDITPESDRNLFDSRNLKLPLLTEAQREDADVLNICECYGRVHSRKQCSVDFINDAAWG